MLLIAATRQSGNATLVKASTKDACGTIASICFGLCVQWITPPSSLKPWLTGASVLGFFFFGFLWAWHSWRGRRSGNAEHHRLFIDWGENVSVARSKTALVAVPGALPLIRPVSFFGIRLVNRSNMLIRGCRVALIFLGIEKKGQVFELWRGNPTLLSFDPLPDEFQKEQDLRSNEPRTVALCSISVHNSYVMFSSLNDGWWHDKSFHEYFTEAGVYVFGVKISSASESHTTDLDIRFYWGNSDGKAFFIGPNGERA